MHCVCAMLKFKVGTMGKCCGVRTFKGRRVGVVGVASSALSAWRHGAICIGGAGPVPRGMMSKLLYIYLIYECIVHNDHGNGHGHGAQMASLRVGAAGLLLEAGQHRVLPCGSGQRVRGV
jgi:hypothetical protein